MSPQEATATARRILAVMPPEMRKPVEDAEAEIRQIVNRSSAPGRLALLLVFGEEMSKPQPGKTI